VATAVFYNRDLEKERRKDKCQEVLIMAMKVTPSEAGPNLWICLLCGQEGHFRWECPRGKDYIQDNAPSVRNRLKGLMPLMSDRIRFTAFQGTMMDPGASHSGSCYCGYNRGAPGHAHS
jgi:hypothetical protein